MMLKVCLKAAIRDNDPVIFMESEQMYGDKGEVMVNIIPLGVADNVRKYRCNYCFFW
jgi:pyruvate dehydrogenase E1 component beta subunit